MIPKASGKMPPAAPCTTRPISITVIVVETAETSVPAESSASAIISRRSLP